MSMQVIENSGLRGQLMIHPIFQSILQAHGAPKPRSRNIKTHYEPPPIPVRNCDWTAIDDDTYDGPGCPVGWGATEQEAIDDLIEKLDD